jgi:hypothetical protein
MKATTIAASINMTELKLFEGSIYEEYLLFRYDDF